MTLLDNITPCPHLGLPDAAETLYMYATVGNHCHKPINSQAVNPAYQSQTCLYEDHVNCPVFQHDGVWNGHLPKDIRAENSATTEQRESWWLLGALAVVLLIFVLGGGFLFFRGDAAPQFFEEQPTATPTLSMTRSPQPTATVPSFPTATHTLTSSPTHNPSHTPTLSPQLPSATPTLAPMETTSLAYASNLRSGPGTTFSVMDFLPANTSIMVLGRNADGDWLFIRLEEGVEGWMALSQVNVDFQPADLPVIEFEPSPTGTVSDSDDDG